MHTPCSPTMSLLPRVLVTTTTVFTGPTDSVQAAPRAAVDVPIGAIVGGSCAGVLLAVVLVVGWRCWGRSIREQQRKTAEKRVSRRAFEWRCVLMDGSRGRQRRWRHIEDPSWTGNEVQYRVPVDQGLSSRPLRTQSPLPTCSPGLHSSRHLRLRRRRSQAALPLPVPAPAHTARVPSHPPPSAGRM